MKIKKLNARGFSHDVVLVAFVAIFSIAGVTYLVASHANGKTATTAAKRCVQQTFRQGNHSACVQDIQYGLDWSNVRGAPHVATNGIFDSKTKKAVVFMQKHQAHTAANGVVNAATWRSVCSNLNRAAYPTNGSTGNLTALNKFLASGCAGF